MYVFFSARIIIENRNQEPNLECQPNQNSHSQDTEKDFWEKPCAFTPESRLEAHRHLEEKKRANKSIRYKNWGNIGEAW